MDVDAAAGSGGAKRTGPGAEHLRLLPPSANWYCSRICDWGRSDAFGLLLAYGAKKSVFIYQVTSGAEEDAAASGSSVKVSFFAHLVRGKRDRRVTAVQFLADTTGELRLVCGGEEGSVQIWDVATLAMIEQHRKHKTEVMAVSVSALDANFVVAGDRQGRITAWERDAGKVSDFVPISGDGIHSMAMSPHEKALVAVGYRSGVLCLVDAAQGTVRHRLAGQDQEVQCVAWKMVVESSRACGEEDADTVEADVSGPKVWLASASRDKTIKVWKMSGREEPALEQALRLPTGKQGMSYTQTKQLWLPVAWSLTGNDTAGKHCLWSGSFDGSLFRWEWTADQVNTHEKKGKNRRVPCKPVVVKGGHNRMLFSIVMVPPRRATPAESEAVSMLTVSLDRELRLWKDTAPSTSSAAAICVEKLTGLGGHAYSVSYNASTGLVAAGIGDQTIRLWSLSSENATAASDYQCDLLWKGLQSKVTCVRWHPLQHSLLAYGMEDGRIGVYDIQTKKYNHFRTAHNHEVRELQWVVLKPKKPADGDNAFLESIKQLEAARKEGQSLEEALTVQEDQGGKPSSASGVQVLLWSGDTAGRVLESNADALDQKSRELMANSVAFAWNERCELVAMGRSNGVVEVAKRNGKASDVITRFHEHLESVSCLTWSNGTNAGLLASGGEDGKIFIYSCADSDLEEGLTGASGAEQEGRLFGSIAAHSNKITGLKWCSDAAQGFLASSSADGTVQVWSSTSLEREARFNHHIGRVLSLDWASPYTLVTGGEDQTLRLWDYREQQKEPSLTQKKTGKVKQPQDFETLVASAPAAVMQQEEAATLSGSRKPQTPSKKPQKKTSGVFHPGTKLTPAEMASACCKAVGLQRASSVAAERKDAVGCLLSHRDRASLRGFFASESKRFRDERDWEGLANTLLIQGDITEALRVVAKEGALTSTWLSYAPMAGMDVWREMTNLYAHQLDAQGDKKAAAFQFLSIAKIRSAVACFVSGDAYDEALALIRARLGPNDPLLHETMWKYAETLSKRGRHGEAALAMLNIGSVKAKARAVHVLVSTGDLALVRTALDVLLNEVNPPTETADQHETGDGGGLSFPASFFVSIAARALAKAQFDVAEVAGRLLQSRLVGASSSASHRLLGCLLSIVKAVDEHQLSAYKPNGAANRVNDLLGSPAPASVSEFFEFVMKPPVGEESADADELYKRAVDGYAPTSLQEAKPRKQWMVDRADHFWVEVLRACQRCGYWFNADGETWIQEAQELLVEASCFSDVENAVATDSSILLVLKVSQGLLRFVLDVMSASFIGALEHLRAVLLLLDAGSAIPRAGRLRLDVMTLVTPVGIVSPQELPQCGELGEEQGDTLVLWSSVLLSQCGILAASVHETKGAPGEWLVESVLHILGGFLDDEAASPLSQGLVDAGNQAQMQTLLNDLLAIANQQGEETHECQLRKQALVNAATDIRSRLTWVEE